MTDRRPHRNLRQPGKWRQLIAFHTFVRFLRQNARQHMVQNSADRIDIGPGSLAAAGMILFLRGIASFQDNGQIFIVIGGKFPGCTKIDQRQRMIRGIHQIFRADIPVQDMFLVHGLQCRKNGAHHSQGFPFCKGLSPLFHLLFERDAGDVRHDKIGRIVTVQHILKLYDAGNIRKTAKKLSLPGKAFHACAEIEALCFVDGQYGFRICSTTGKVSRKILFDGNDRFRLQIHGNIGNAKTTLSKWSSHQIFSL